MAYLHRRMVRCLHRIDNLKKNLLNSNISSTCSHNMVNFDPLAAVIGLPVWGTLANFNRFRVLASLLHRHCSTDVSRLQNFARCLAVSLDGARCRIPFVSKSCVLLYWQTYCTALEQWASAKLCGVVQGMDLRNLRSSPFSTEGATYIPRAAITLGIGPHSSIPHIILFTRCASDSITRLLSLVVHRFIFGRCEV